VISRFQNFAFLKCNLYRYTKALAVSGLSVVGRDRYGVFPLRGKLLNGGAVQTFCT
jgi:hypothetical protein